MISGLLHSINIQKKMEMLFTSSGFGNKGVNGSCHKRSQQLRKKPTLSVFKQNSAKMITLRIKQLKILWHLVIFFLPYVCESLQNNFETMPVTNLATMQLTGHDDIICLCLGPKWAGKDNYCSSPNINI